MKKLIITLLLSFTGAAQAAPQTWKSEEEKVIYIAPAPRLSVAHTAAEASEEAWDYITLSLNYESADMVAQAKAVKAANPGYTISKVSIRASGVFTLEIPSLGLSREITPMPGVEGPYFNFDLLVAKKDSPRVREALKNAQTFASVKGKLTVSIPATKVIEKVTLPAAICQNLKSQGTDLYQVMLAYPKVESQIITIAKEEENRKSLRNQVLRSCLEIKNAGWVRDFASLLKLEVEDGPAKGDFTAELKRKIEQSQEIHLRYVVGEE